MKAINVAVLIGAAAAMTHAAVIQSITFDLSQIHAGSKLSGTFTLPDSPKSGDTAVAPLTFSDPANYSPTSLNTTITVVTSPTNQLQLDFSQIAFTNLSGVTTPINTKDVILQRQAWAVCTSFPCSSAGNFQDRTPTVFTGTYTIAPAATTGVPEPSYAAPALGFIAAFFLGRRALRRS